MYLALNVQPYDTDLYKMAKHTLKILQHLLLNFQSVLDHFVDTINHHSQIIQKVDESIHMILTSDFDKSTSQKRTPILKIFVCTSILKYFWVFIKQKYLTCISQKHKQFLKQPTEVLCKKRSSEKFRKLHRKTPVPESLF